MLINHSHSLRGGYSAGGFIILILDTLDENEPSWVLPPESMMPCLACI